MAALTLSAPEFISSIKKLKPGFGHSLSAVSRMMLSILCICHFLSAQQVSQKGILHGSLRDGDSGSPIVGGSIVIIGSTIGGITDENGALLLVNIPPGTYQLRLSSVGYAQEILRNVIVRAGDTTRINGLLREQTIEMEGVVVSGTKLDDAVSMPQSMHYLEYKEIHNSAGAFDDVIRTVSVLPGLSHMRPDRNDLLVRGGAPSENLFLIDKFESPSINHFGIQGAGGGYVGFINFELVDNYVFSNGGFGVPYGDKLSSVLEIGLREGRADRFHAQATLSATQLGLNGEGPTFGNGSYIFSARRSYLEPVFQYYGFGYVPYYYDFLVKIQQPIDKENKVEFLTIAAIDRMKVYNDTPQKIFDNSRTMLSNQNTVLSGATWYHALNDGTLSASIREFYADFDYYQFDLDLINRFKNISFEDESSLKIDYLQRVSDASTLHGGFDIKHISLKSRMIAKVTATGYSDYPVTIPVDTTNASIAYKSSAFFQWVQSIENFTMTAGIRSDYFSLIKKGWAFSPRLSLSYVFAPLTTVTMSVGRYHQAPAYIWLMTNPFNRQLTHLGLNQYTFGIERHISAEIKISLEAYIKDYFNYPASLTRPYLVMVNTGAGASELGEAYASFGLDFLTSEGKGITKGVEFYIEKRLSEIPLYGKASVTYSKAEFTALDGATRPSSNDQRWVLSMGGGYILDENWEVTSTFRYSSGRPYTPFGFTTWLRSSNLFNTGRTSPNHSLDIRISRAWVFDTMHLKVYLDIQNVYNKKWIDVPFWSSRNNRVETPPAIGIVPSVGIIAEF